MNSGPNDASNLQRRQELQREEEAFRLDQEEKRLNKAKRGSTFVWITNSILWLAGIVQVLLVMRFFLRLFGANIENWFAQLIYRLSEPLIAPFSTLFISPTSAEGANIFDLNIAIAIFAYALLSYFLVSLTRFIFYQRL
ncbi:MAG: YggT family protein [Cyanobacteria bacterium]|nr:YggT family protein [Cyanobacteriota bacterium]MDA0866078.1 YggT family protein [Cyanobacteriota bacterium]